MALGRRSHGEHRSRFAAGLAGSLHHIVYVGCFGQGQNCNLQSGECESLLDMESGCVLRKKGNEELEEKVTRGLRLRKRITENYQEWQGKRLEET